MNVSVRQYKEGIEINVQYKTEKKSLTISSKAIDVARKTMHIDAEEVVFKAIDSMLRDTAWDYNSGDRNPQEEFEQPSK